MTIVMAIAIPVAIPVLIDLFGCAIRDTEPVNDLLPRGPQRHGLEFAFRKEMHLHRTLYAWRFAPLSSLC
jgi:hypothetical protein